MEGECAADESSAESRVADDPFHLFLFIIRKCDLLDVFQTKMTCRNACPKCNDTYESYLWSAILDVDVTEESLTTQEAFEKYLKKNEHGFAGRSSCDACTTLLQNIWLEVEYDIEITPDILIVRFGRDESQGDGQRAFVNVCLRITTENSMVQDYGLTGLITKQDGTFRVYILKDATWRMTEGEGPMQQVDNILSCVDPSLIYMAVYERTLSTSYDVKAGIIGKVATECDDNTSTDGEDEDEDEEERFVWDSVAFDKPQELERKKDPVKTCKKDSRKQAGNLKDVCWTLKSAHASYDEGKKAAKELCGECGYKWLQQRPSYSDFVCSWEMCPFVMKLVPYGENYMLYVDETREHVHGIVGRRTGVPTCIQLLVQQNWKEWCKLKPQQVRNLMTTARVNSDISEKNAEAFKLLFQNEQVVSSFGRWFKREKNKQESLENIARRNALSGCLVNSAEWHDMFFTESVLKEGTLGAIHTWARGHSYNEVKKREDFGPHSVYLIAYKLKEVCVRLGLYIC